MNDPRPPLEQAAARGAAGAPVRHDSAHLHVAGEAAYTDDILEARGTLHAAFGLSKRPHARIKSLDLSAVRAAPGVVAVLTAADVPGENNVGPILHDDPILAADEVQFVGQPIFLVVADSVDAARRAARLGAVEYEDLPAILTIEAALAKQSFVVPSVTLQRGDWQGALAGAPHRLKGAFRIGGQEQFYLEGQISYAIPREGGQILIHSSTQDPGDVQHKVAHALGCDLHAVVVECRRMGGGFGGKETQAALFACAAAILARRTGRPVKFRVDRDDDFLITGKRHDFRVDYDVGFDDDGRICAVEVVLASRCGHSADLSNQVNDRAMMHVDNCYYFENIGITSYRCRTHTHSNTAFRGFGGPQGMMAAEVIIDEVARALGKDPLEIRKINFYGIEERNVTPYRMTIDDNIIHTLVSELESSAEYARRRSEIRRFNDGSPIVKRGIAFTPVKFGISFTSAMFNQGGALVNVFTDGTVILNHGGTEMGQGLFIKVAQVVAEELQIDVDRVRVSAADTSKVPNASATAASTGSDINGKAAQAAARTIKARLVEFAAERFGVAPAEVRFEANQVHAGDQVVSFGELVRLAWMGRVSLSATGFYRTPKVGFDLKNMRGRPYYYFAYGVAVSEVAVDTLTGESRLLRADLLHDVGRSLNPAVDLGQVEGGFVQGMGWLTTEELWWSAEGRLMTHAPSTYKIPAASDVPADLRVRLYERGENVEDSIFRSKAVGEPPLMLAISVFQALRDAIASVADGRTSPRLDAPATPERILLAIEDVRSRASQAMATVRTAGAR
jgi:xanthine dehydrogenase large subunit